MVITFQKIAIITLSALSLFFLPLAHAQSVRECGQGDLKVGQKNVGKATYFAQNCQSTWKNQDIRMDFAYIQNIPEWAFKRAATHFLKRNIKQANTLKQLDQITQLYQPVRSGDIYSLSYNHTTQTLTLSLNQKILGKIQYMNANDYFNIWLGSSPFSDTLKKQLLD